MGMFDELRCKYPLPVEGAEKLLFQTKDTDAQFLDQYEIREDGTLWHEAYETEDHSIAGKWMKEHPGEKLPESFGFKEWRGLITRVGKRWEQVQYEGNLNFYTCNDDGGGWIEFNATFKDGKVVLITKETK